MSKNAKDVTLVLTPNTINPKYFDKYIIVPYRALCVTGMTAIDAIVYGYLNEFARNNPERVVWEQSKSISKKLNLHRNTILRALENLNKMGLIEIRQSKDNTRVYKVLRDLRDLNDTLGEELLMAEYENEDEEDIEESFVPQKVKDILKNPYTESTSKTSKATKATKKSTIKPTAHATSTTSGTATFSTLDESDDDMDFEPPAPTPTLKSTKPRKASDVLLGLDDVNF